MSLPHLIKFIYNHGTEEVVRRGKKIHAIGFADMTEHDDLLDRVVFRVRDDIYSTFYKFRFKNIKRKKISTFGALALTIWAISAGMRWRVCFSCRIWWNRGLLVMMPFLITNSIRW